MIEIRERPERNPIKMESLISNETKIYFHQEAENKRNSYRLKDKYNRPPIGVMPRWRRMELTVLDLIRAAREYLEWDMRDASDDFMRDALDECYLYWQLYLKNDKKIKSRRDVLKYIINNENDNSRN